MNIQELETTLKAHGLSIDSWQGGAGQFRDLHIGTGQPYWKLEGAAQALRADGLDATMTQVTNDQHADFGKPYVEVKSFWWE